jgi:hypothetical protein
MPRIGRNFCVGALCAIAVALTTSRGHGEDARAPATPNPQAQVQDVCNIESTVWSASIVQTTGDSVQRKRWQPQGGVVQFTVKTFVTIPENASFFVCFRWRTIPENAQYQQTRPDQLDHNGAIWTVTATIPELGKVPPGSVQEEAFPLVPLADVRIIAVKTDMTLMADARTKIGVTYPILAIIWAILTIVVLFFALHFCARSRLKAEGIKKAFWLLRIISTPSGYASLSKLQIVLWTLVVATSAVYVMALSGDLIAISNGTLVLLGIAGTAALGAKVHEASQSSAAEAAAVTAKQDENKAKIEAAQKATAASNAAQTSAEFAANAIAQDAARNAQKIAAAAIAKADAFTTPPADQSPRWTDLIVNENSEIDVTRFQMLLFTLITAAFVLLNVLTTYVIPEIPTGFLTLMGISNGVYLGAKVAQGS